jgi:hypothetical protein
MVGQVLLNQLFLFLKLQLLHIEWGFTIIIR